MSWSRRFDSPIELPDGRKLRTLKDAAEYVLALPPKIQKEQVSIGVGLGPLIGIQKGPL